MKNSLEQAHELKLRSISIPAIRFEKIEKVQIKIFFSSGIFGFDKELW